MTNFSVLKDRHRKERHSYSEYLSVRVHRALSWLQRAEQCGEDLDGQFIFLWIAFNAAYANEIIRGNRPHEQEAFNLFLQRLCDLDDNQRLHDLIWKEYTNHIRTLLDNKHVYQPFWDYKNGKITEEEWADNFSRARKAAARAIGRGDTPKVLGIILSRLYTLRNQLMHGGATWNSSVNRDQIRDCSRIIGCLVPAIIEIMMDHTNELWGQPCYPVLG